jgi:cytochrome c5
MSNNRILIGAIVATFALNLSAPGLAQDAAPSLSVETVFNQRCKSCHEPAVERAPGRAELAFRAPADIVTALTTGVMAPMAKGLSRS